MRCATVIVGWLTVAAGCQLTEPRAPLVGPSLPPPLQPVAHVEPTPPTGPVGLVELLALAESRHPDLMAARARVVEAQGRLVQAGLYPNPTVGYMGSEINEGPGTAGQQGGFVSQEIVTAGKLGVARTAARFGVTATDWRAVSQWYETLARVKAAYFEVVTARDVLHETEQLAALFREGLRKAEQLAAAGHVLAYDAVRLRVEVAQAENRVGAARERVAAAERMLAVAVGVERLPDLTTERPPWSEPPPFEMAATAAEQSSFVADALAQVEQARAELQQAELKPVPNLQVQAGVMQDAVQNVAMANVQFGVALPVFDRNQGAILAARGRLAVALAGVDQARLRTRERLAAAYQRYQNARRQLELYETRILPDSETALRQIEAVYDKRGERFLDTLDARRMLGQARIDYAQALGDLGAALAEIEALTQPAR